MHSVYNKKNITHYYFNQFLFFRLIVLLKSKCNDCILFINFILIF